jgi:hypothetical protein
VNVKRGLYDLSYRNVLMNSSKTCKKKSFFLIKKTFICCLKLSIIDIRQAVSSDSSQSDRELQLINNNGSSLTSPLSTSSPNQYQKSLNQSTINETSATTNSTNTSTTNGGNGIYTNYQQQHVTSVNSNINKIFSILSPNLPSPRTNGLTSSLNISLANTTTTTPPTSSSGQHIQAMPTPSKLAKPYNSQSGAPPPTTTTAASIDSNSMHKLAISNCSNMNNNNGSTNSSNSTNSIVITNSSNQNRASTLSLVGGLPQFGNDLLNNNNKKQLLISSPLISSSCLFLFSFVPN